MTAITKNLVERYRNSLTINDVDILSLIQQIQVNTDVINTIYIRPVSVVLGDIVRKANSFINLTAYDYLAIINQIQQNLNDINDYNQVSRTVVLGLIARNCSDGKLPTINDFIAIVQQAEVNATLLTTTGASLVINPVTGQNLQLLTQTGVAGLVQKLDGFYQTFPGNQLRKTDRGLLVEPASQNFVAFSANFNDATWAISNTFTGKVAKTSLILGQTAYEFESDTTAGLLNQANRGTFSASPEILSYLVEAMPSAVDFEFYIHDQTANQAVVRRSFNFTTKVWTSFGGTGSSQRHGSIEFGLGPNGGQVYLLFIYATPPTVGNTRRFFVYPNGSTNTIAGKKVTLHLGQSELGTWITSPIINPNTTSNTRSAEVITASIPTGTYDIRYTLQDGTIVDRYGVTSIANLLTLPTDILQSYSIRIGDAFISSTQRNGYITNIAIWPQKTNNIRGLGDSYLVLGAVGGQSIIQWIAPKLYRPRVWTFDGVGATSITQQATRFDSTPSFYGDLLVIVDGIIDGLVSISSYTTLVKPAIESMIAHLTTNPKQWFYVQPLPDFASGPWDPASATIWWSVQNQIKADYPNNYIETLPTMQAHGDGSAGDKTDIQNGGCPRSLRISSSDVHTNEIGSMWYATAIVQGIQAKGY